jgi:hemerythrin
MENPERQPVVLGFGPMDAVHAEFDTLVAETLRADDAELPHALERLAVHLRAHFEAEDGWMRETDFPARDCHIDEHAAVRRSADEVLARVAVGDFAIGRDFVRELERWFPGHADYLDSALAAWMCKRRFGGKPVVIQRRPAAR